MPHVMDGNPRRVRCQVVDDKMVTIMSDLHGYGNGNTPKPERLRFLLVRVGPIKRGCQLSLQNYGGTTN